MIFDLAHVSFLRSSFVRLLVISFLSLPRGIYDRFFSCSRLKKKPLFIVSPKAIAWGYPLVIVPYIESVGFVI